ncbi:unnamed protein product [Brugia pahangi]|uniref:Non-specific serine/threonine protein kinase n=1 Tax=Brugia pahangi TaxID=6280 RepID=A0A158PRD4_BRUPA|nr:unnamed protein product [Brugia pahangi]
MRHQEKHFSERDAISRSLHELASVTIKNDDGQNKFLRRIASETDVGIIEGSLVCLANTTRQPSSDIHSSSTYRKNSFPSAFVSQHDIRKFPQSFSSDDDQSANAEYYMSSRRKRFTRHQRRNLTGGISGERTWKSTSALNKVHRSESTTNSSDNGSIIIERRKRSTQLTTRKKRGQSTAACGAITPAEAAFLSLKRNYVNSSLITRSIAETCCKSTSTRLLASNEPVDTLQKFKGPAARKARRRTLRYKLNSFTNNELETKGGSQTRLNNTQSGKATFVRRSISVRELNGTMIDFTNQDSVTRWTSQILAEIDSLPSSSFDLTAQSIPLSSPFISTATSITTDIITTGTTDVDIICADEPECGTLKPNILCPSENNSDISFEMSIIDSTLSAQSHNNKPQNCHRTQKVELKPSRFIKFRKTNSWKKAITTLGCNELYDHNVVSTTTFQDIWRQSADIPEASCTAHIVLTAQPSSRHKQSAHAVVISAPKNPERSEKLHFLSSKFSSNNNENSQSHASLKSGSGSYESSPLWRFLSRKKYQSFKKYLKWYQKGIPTIGIVSDIEVSLSGMENSPVITNDKNHLPECNLQPKWRNDKVESNGGLPVSRTNLALALDVKPYQRFLRMSNSAQGKLLDYTILNDVQWRSSIYDANVKINNDASIGSRTCFSMESIDLTKESSTDDRLKFLGEAKRIELLDEAQSPVAIWKQRREKRVKKEERVLGDSQGSFDER